MQTKLIFLEVDDGIIVVVQLLSHVQFSATQWTAAFQASQSFTILEFAPTHVHWVSDAIQPSIGDFYFSCFLIVWSHLFVKSKNRVNS